MWGNVHLMGDRSLPGDSGRLGGLICRSTRVLTGVAHRVSDHGAQAAWLEPLGDPGLDLGHCGAHPIRVVGRKGLRARPADAPLHEQLHQLGVGVRAREMIRQDGPLSAPFRLNGLQIPGSLQGVVGTR